MSRHSEAQSVDGAVVVGVDSRTPRQTLDWAVAEAVSETRPLVLMHSTGTLGTAGTTWLPNADPSTSSVLHAMEQQGIDIVREAVNIVGSAHPDLEVHTLVVAEEPVLELLKLAKNAHLPVLESPSHWMARLVPLWRTGARAAHRAADVSG